MSVKKILLGIVLSCILLGGCSYLPEQEFVIPSQLEYEETSEYIQLSLPGAPLETALLFVPGGLVDPHAYLPLLEKVAEAGTAVVLLKVAANLAILETGKALKVVRQMPEFSSWYVGGHSLGGIAALSAVNAEPGTFRGAILLGSYATEAFSIATWDRNVLSVYAELDGLSTPANITTNAEFLPPAFALNNPAVLDTLPITSPYTLYYEVRGGNHAQFGNYGRQEGDGASTISPTEQHVLTSQVIASFIEWNEKF